MQIIRTSSVLCGAVFAILTVVADVPAAYSQDASEHVAKPDQVVAAETAYSDLLAKYGVADPKTIQSLFALAQTLNAYRRYEEAEQRGRELLKTFEDAYGPEHPNTGYPLDILATALKGQGKSADALKYRELGYQRLANHFGPAHEMPLQRARLLAIDYAELGKVDEARSLLDANLARAEKIPPLHAQYLNTKAFLLKTTDGAEAAIPVMEDLLGLERSHGLDQTSGFASNLYNLATLYLEAGDKQKALDASSEAGMIALQTYGPDHPAAQDIFKFQTELREAKQRGEF